MKKIIILACAAVISFAMTVSLVSCKKDKGNRVVVKGSTTVLPITQKAAEAFKKTEGINVFVEGSGSGNGIKALIEGGCDIANSSREMKAEEKESAKKKGIEVKEILIAYDMIVPIVHPSNPVKNLSMDQLKAIYDGSIKNWKELGGKDENIVVISRDTSSGTYEIWHEKVMKKTDVRGDALLQASNGAIITTVAGNSKAIGYVGFGYINDTVKGITVNGIDVTIENGKTGKFLISRKLYMYVNKNKLSDKAQKFIDYLLSAAGQTLVREAGYIPL
ncbi:MAG TPA: PstS family phosphate ABC transporter substrate-binding protein [Spirochaetota bacterium]|nr:PstS family phosphate ABC transporter substrate-binding protein [Spirochaetota bacterium]HPC40312.1 PstS family phosphate ABC transporter substrate-binding protein [Spirochaetota bacterium]HPL18255.1 PstS family phosphate ABC transporter substrate-binding protein [Spirochaetota bacterium]HQF07214.1 PstS family phosphate ABC transporter substrate-binding protein [Spirochaetota bacterium]HQH96114.1 PstS family phosphate ABC transporter substrate-binding protein [Spirochaetota bacterium]